MTSIFKYTLQCLEICVCAHHPQMCQACVGQVTSPQQAVAHGTSSRLTGLYLSLPLHWSDRHLTTNIQYNSQKCPVLISSCNSFSVLVPSVSAASCVTQ